MLGLAGKVCFITGSSRGIGWACARLLAEQGATVVLNARTDQAHLDTLARDLAEATGSRVIGFACDAAQPDEIRSTYRRIFSEFRRLDVLVNNAGILDDALIGMVSDSTLEQTFTINAVGAAHHLQCAARLMQRARSGSIINMTSIVGRHGNAGQMAYASSKAALIGLTLSAGKELASSGIRVNAVAPGFIDTDMARSVPEPVFAQRVASIGMGRIGTTEDVAKAVGFLASPWSEYITGQVIGVDGGMVI